MASSDQVAFHGERDGFCQKVVWDEESYKQHPFHNNTRNFQLTIFINFVRINFYGDVAQLGERGVRNAEVRGSIPLISTKILIQSCQMDSLAAGDS